jgi:hypothetical protein
MHECLRSEEAERSGRLVRGPTDLELSCEHPRVELNGEKMLEGKREVAVEDARVFVSWSEGWAALCGLVMVLGC